MARILMCWELGSGLAYIEGLTLVAKKFKKAGHEVLFAARDLGHAERLLGGKFQFYQAPTQVSELDRRLPLPMTFADVLHNLGYGIPDNVTARVRAWRNLLDHVKPDIIRCAHSPGALLAARGTAIRTIPVGIGFLQPPPVCPLPNLRPWDKTAIPERMAAREHQVLQGMNQGLDAIGAPRVASVGALYNETDICELYTYPELDDYGPRDKVNYRGNFQPGFGDSPAWPTRGGKRIFAYLQTHKLTPQVLQILADTGQSVLVYMSGAPEELRTRFAGSNLAFVDQPLNIAETAMQCDLGVTHGGHNIVGSLMQAGKPQLCLPTLLPERLTAAKIEGLGTGLMTDVQFSDLREKLARLLQEAEFTEKARALGGRLTHFNMEAAMQGALESIETLAKPRA
jgi:UDP:flavonoid glycosyltransferase YjiC (YdhE family)